MLYHSHYIQACNHKRDNNDATITPTCPIMSSIFQCLKEMHTWCTNHARQFAIL